MFDVVAAKEIADNIESVKAEINSLEDAFMTIARSCECSMINGLVCYHKARYNAPCNYAMCPLIKEYNDSLSTKDDNKETKEKKKEDCK